MKIVVIGAAGQLGRAITPLLSGEVVALTRGEADLTRPAELKARLEELRPNLVVNCSAYNLVDRAEAEPQAAFAVNAWGVRDLALICGSLDAVLVHISTDYVFGLEHSAKPWTEADAPGPVSVYGLSKLSGEFWVRQTSERNLVVRTCGLYGFRGEGGKGGNFVETMLRLAGEGKPLRVVGDQRCTPSFVNDVAGCIAELIAQDAKGLFHLTNAGECSWHEFAQETFRITGVHPSLTAIPTSEYKTAARRPLYSVLSCRKASDSGLPPMRPWQEALADYLSLRAKPN